MYHCEGAVVVFDDIFSSFSGKFSVDGPWEGVETSEFNITGTERQDVAIFKGDFEEKGLEGGEYCCHGICLADENHFEESVV